MVETHVGILVTHRDRGRFSRQPPPIVTVVMWRSLDLLTIIACRTR